MPSFPSEVVLSGVAQSNNTILADIEFIKGAFKLYTADEMNSAHPNYFENGQIVYTTDSGSLYKANKVTADPGQGIYEDSVSFSEFSFDSGSFTSASFDGTTNILTLFGQSLIGSVQVSSSVDLSSLSGGGGSVGTLQQVTTQGNTTDVSMSIQGIEIFSATETNGDKSGSIFIGANAAERSTINNSGLNQTLNTVIGFNAAAETSFLNSRNTTVGGEALRGASGGSTSNNNTAIGALSLYDLQDGSGQNTALGHQSFVHLRSGSNMIGIGNNAGYNIASGSNSIFIGNGTGNGTNTSENEIVIGTNVVGNGNNTVTIGNSTVTHNYFVGNITGSTDVYIANWGSISASLASLSNGSDITAVNSGLGLGGGASSGDVTLTLDTSSTHFVNAVNNLGLFQETGSFYSTTNNIQITGSLTVGDGLFKLKEYSVLPTAEAGAFAYSSNNFYLGFD